MLSCQVIRGPGWLDAKPIIRLPWSSGVEELDIGFVGAGSVHLPGQITEGRRIRKLSPCLKACGAPLTCGLHLLHCSWQRKNLYNPAHQFVCSLKDRRRRPEGGEWEPIKIPRGNLAYILKSTRRPSLLNRSRPRSYRKSIGPRNQVRQLENIMEDNNSMQAKTRVRLRWPKLNQKTAQVITGISLNTL
jgi:hypothetical protein